MLTLSQIKGVGDATIKKLNELDIKSVFELFSFLPTKYIDLQAPISVTKAGAGMLNLFEGTVLKVSGVSPRGKRMFSVSFSDNLAEGRICFKATFYNMPFLHDSFAVGNQYRLFGRLSKEEGVFNIVNPQLEKLDKVSKLKGIYTVYPLKGVFGQNSFKNIMINALDELKTTKYEGRLARINEDLGNAFLNLHMPKSVEEAEDTLDTLASLDIAIVLSMYRKMRNSALKSRKVFYNLSDFRIDTYTNTLNFELTQSQQIACEDILNSMKSDKNISRIVSGDVGSGKTAVAFFAMVACALGGRQCALMAPTEILAKQHATAFAPIAEKLGVSFALLTSATPAMEKRYILDGLKDGSISCVIGTQALIAEAVEFSSLALGIIDEQHRFGVNERRLLESKGAVDIISLTATPIPRSMALTFYDDIDISVIEKRESAKTNVQTVLVNSTEEGVARIVNECRQGKQAFVVCPSIVDAEGYALTSIEGFMREFGGSFEGLSVQVLHGKMSNDEKTLAMKAFAEGKTQILVATTVVEVGIDTLASEILILNADRFGLASLHQLRGRVGRDGREAHCFIQADCTSDKSLDRLDVFCAHNDGQYLAEADFALRGAGDFIGTRQSGASCTPIFGLKMSADVLKSAKT
ncbi:MAG: DEAD/DEAH box helicase, partial [Clostridia bacterium]|nr:DEAD/DEAH box helicase [Clostridia bacterium]